MRRLTISGGVLKFYEPVYTKCSNANNPQIRKQRDAGVPFYDIKEYRTAEYSDEHLSKMYDKLSKIEDILEEYGIDSMEELEARLEVKECGKKKRIETIKLKRLKTEKEELERVNYKMRKEEAELRDEITRFLSFIKKKGWCISGGIR